MKQRSLFRKEVLEKNHTEFGIVHINLPILYPLIVIFLCVFIILFLFFITKVKIAEKYTVRGYINSDKGISSIYPIKSGVIIKQNVKPGDKVTEGDVLFVVDTNINSANKSPDKDIINNLLIRQEAIQDAIDLHNKKLASLKELLKKKYISLNDYNEAYKELLELKNKKQTIEFEIIKYRNDKAYSVRANTSGIVTNVFKTKWHYIKPNNVIAQIIPSDSKLVAELYVPVEKSGFLNIGDQIFINYDAYSHTRFGSYKGTIKHISEIILTDREEIKPIMIGSPYYKILACIEQPTINFYGNKKKIQQGMTFSAVIEGRKRTILEWILDPLLSFYGKMC